LRTRRIALYDNNTHAIGAVPAPKRGDPASARDIPRAQVALAWLLAKPVSTAPIVGATKFPQFDDALASVAVKLTVQEIATIEEP
jgi:aryl-alcohol dehydrogenase (NADP+)